MRRRRRSDRRRNGFGKFAQELEKFELAPETRRAVFALLWFLAAISAILALFGTAGRLGEWLRPQLFTWMGAGAYVIPFLVAFVALTRIDPGRFPFNRSRYVGMLLVIVTGLGLLHLPTPVAEGLAVADEGKGGGYVGWLVTYWLGSAIGEVMMAVALVVLFIAGLILFSNHTPGQFFTWARRYRAARAQEKLAQEAAEEPRTSSPFSTAEAAASGDEKERSTEETEAASSLPVFAMRSLDGVTIRGRGQPAGESRVLGKLPPYAPPSLELLSRATTRPVSTDISATQQVIQRTLDTFGIAVEMGDVFVGPTVTQYTLRPAEGMKLSKILALHNDLALALAAHPLRIEAPIPGKGLVGIEVPNKTVSIVRLREILESGVFADARGPLTFALGKDVSGSPIVTDLGGMPHLLVAGATGSGKSVTINSLLVSLLYRNGPATMKLILVDPKRVELPLFDGIPHLLSPVITDAVKTVNALHWTVAEMDRRYELLSAARKRDVLSYNAGRRPEATLPHIVLVIDELADIMARHARDVEDAVIRLAQIARAVGIHLVLATQRPSVDVITGLIKANITTRIAFKVASGVDSRTILDTTGAEKLLGSGDMLFLASGETKPRRLQGAYVSEEEVKGVVRFLTHGAEVSYDTAVTASQGARLAAREGGEDDVDDELYEEAKRVAVEASRASTSLFQRRLRIGYGRAARILDLLEERGVIGPPDGARPREVLIGRGDQGASASRQSTGEGASPIARRRDTPLPVHPLSSPTPEEPTPAEDDDQLS